MDTSLSNNRDFQISPERLLALLRGTPGRFDQRPSDDQPLPPGPWDPVIRSALRRMDVLDSRSEAMRELLFSFLARRRPEMYDVIPRLEGGRNPLEEVALNPQPLPPRWALLEAVAQVLIERLELLQEIASALTDEGEQRGIIIVSGYISRMLDEICGTGYRPRFPFPGPRPRWFPEELDGLDLLLLASHFDQAAQETYSAALRESLAGASVKLVDAALSKQ